tara:strand:- start:1393 stop:2175 length:783 start_codon:yes stop_codon:yes gene_type:complete
MQSGIPIGTNPLLETMMFGDGSRDMTEEMQEYREKQKEAELRLLGTMLFQSVLLAFCIMLYVNWSWSHFNTAYESAIFYGFAGFSVQAAFYFIYRAVFEDSSDHRRQLKRMRNKNRQRMAHLKFEQEKAQLEAVLGQQMSIYQSNLGAAMADNVITPQESEVLAGNLSEIQQLMAQLQQLQQVQQQPQQAQQSQPVTAESLGIDRHRIMGIPVGPKLTLDQSLPKSSQDSTVLNLAPQGTQDQIVAQEAADLEQAAESLQ